MMKLTYRGVSYDYTPNSVPPMSVFAVGKYRGATVPYRRLDEVPEQPGEDLVWRGVHYQSGTSATAPAETAVTAPAVPVAAEAAEPVDLTVMARNLFVRHHQRIRRREQGMMVRLAAEVGIPVEVAARYESQIQGKVPHNFAGYDRSSTAMS